MKNVIYENKSDPHSLQYQHILGAIKHLHKEIEIIYVVEGQATAYADRFCATLRTGDLFISFPNQVHYYENCKPGIYQVMILSPNIFFGLKSKFNDFLPEKNIVHIAENEQLVKNIEKCFSASGEYRNTAITGYMNLLMSELMPQLTLKPRLQTNNSTLKCILDFCSAHYSEEITLENVAEELHLSKYYISRLLNNKISISFNDYINNLRIDEACALLIETDKKIADISEDVGFGTIRSFNRAFQRAMNMTPFQYRELQQNQSSDFK